MATKVEVLTSEMVAPAEETPAGAIWLSNLDLAARRGYTPTVYFFRSNGEPGFFAADAVKASLARALVAFYPLAGRLGADAATGRLQIDCTGEGAVFVTARSAHYSLDDLMREFVPCREMRDLFVPPTNPPACALLLVQVTRLRCGGVVLGQAMHHSVCDARGAAHFFETWASISRGDPADAAPVPPCFDYGLLAARPAAARAVLYNHPEYKPEPETTPLDAAGSDYASAIINMTKAQVTALKARCPGASTFRAVAALVWRCACRARSLPHDAETRLYSMIDMRARLAPPLPPGYFGNAERGGAHVGVGHGGGGGVEPGRARGAARAGGDEPGRRLREVAGGLPGRRGRHGPATERHLQGAPPRYQLGGNVAVQGGFRVGRAGVHGAGAYVLQWIRVRDERGGKGWGPRARAVAGAG